MRRSACLALTMFALLAPALGAVGPAHATGAVPRANRLPVWPSLGNKRVGRWETRLRLSAATKPNARCTAALRAGKQKVTLPTLIASHGRAAWSWTVGPGAPSGRWTLSIVCVSHAAHGHATIRPFVLTTALGKQTPIVAPGSLSVDAGRSLKPLHHEGPKSATGRGAGGGNPFASYPGYCTWGAWQHAQWLGGAVWGNAGDWYGEAQGKLPTGTTPVPGAVFVWKIGYYGHVGIVTGPANSQGFFPTAEMNGGRMIDSANAITSEFNKWVAHSDRHTGPDMFFIYKPGTEPGSFNPANYNGHIVKQNDGSVTSWLVADPQGHRNWIPDQATYNCLKSQGHPGPDLLSADQLNKLPDQNGVWAKCSNPSPQPPAPSPQPPAPSPQPPAPSPQPPAPSPQPPAGDKTPPSTPAGLSASAGQTSLNLTWSVSSDNVGVAGYFVFLNGAHVQNATGASASLSGLTCNTSYTLGVDAYDAAGNHSSTASISASTAGCPSSASAGEDGLGLEGFAYNGLWLHGIGLRLHRGDLLRLPRRRSHGLLLRRRPIPVSHDALLHLYDVLHELGSLRLRLSGLPRLGERGRGLLGQVDVVNQQQQAVARGTSESRAVLRPDREAEARRPAARLPARDRLRRPPQGRDRFSLAKEATARFRISRGFRSKNAQTASGCHPVVFAVGRDTTLTDDAMYCEVDLQIGIA